MEPWACGHWLQLLASLPVHFTIPAGKCPPISVGRWLYGPQSWWRRQNLCSSRESNSSSLSSRLVPVLTELPSLLFRLIASVWGIRSREIPRPFENTKSGNSRMWRPQPKVIERDPHSSPSLVVPGVMRRAERVSTKRRKLLTTSCRKLHVNICPIEAVAL